MNQLAISLHSASTQPRPDKGKCHLHPKATKSRPLQITPPKDQPHALTKVYKDCTDRISKLWPKPIQIPVDLDDPRVAHLGPLSKPTRLLAQEEEFGYFKNWEPYNPEDWEPYYFEAFKEWETYPPLPTRHHQSSTLYPSSYQSYHATFI